MKRRGFLSFMGGAAVAGPSMAKQAAMSLVDLQLPVAASSLADSNFGASVQSTFGMGDHWSIALAKHLAKSPERKAWEKAHHQVSALDPDIAAMRSIALHAKIRMQRDRDYERQENRQRDWLEHAVMGWFD